MKNTWIYLTEFNEVRILSVPMHASVSDKTIQKIHPYLILRICLCVCLCKYVCKSFLGRNWKNAFTSECGTRCPQVCIIAQAVCPILHGNFCDSPDLYLRPIPDICHKVCNFTHRVQFYTQSVIVHTECNFTHRV